MLGIRTESKKTHTKETHMSSIPTTIRWRKKENKWTHRVFFTLNILYFGNDCGERWVNEYWMKECIVRHCFFLPFKILTFTSFIVLYLKCLQHTKHVYEKSVSSVRIMRINSQRRTKIYFMTKENVLNHVLPYNALSLHMNVVFYPVDSKAFYLL